MLVLFTIVDNCKVLLVNNNSFCRLYEFVYVVIADGLYIWFATAISGFPDEYPAYESVGYPVSGPRLEIMNAIF